MTLRDQIEEMLMAGERNCVIARNLNCRTDYVYRIRSIIGAKKVTATDRRISTIKSMVMAGKSDKQIADHLCVSATTVKNDRQKYGIQQRQFHRKHSEIVRMKIAGFKQICIMLELGVSPKTIRKAWERHLRSIKNTGTKTDSAGRVNQQFDMTTTTDLQSDRPSDSVSPI